jgi:hypothetical protein
MLCKVLETKEFATSRPNNRQEVWHEIILVGANGKCYKGFQEKQTVAKHTKVRCNFKPGDIVSIKENGTKAETIRRLKALDKDNSKQRLAEIAKWEDDALAESDILRYFFATPEAKEVLSIDRWLVLGNKGTGKTAIARYISSFDAKDGVWNRNLNFSDFVHYEDFLKDRAPDFERGLLDLWRYIILSAAAECVFLDTATDSDTREKLRPFFSASRPKQEIRLFDWLRGLLSPTRLLALSGSAVAAGYNHYEIAAGLLPHAITSHEPRHDVREGGQGAKLCLEHLLATTSALGAILKECGFPEHAPRRVYISLDQLDESYNRHTNQTYFSIISCLLNAARDINREFSSSNPNCQISAVVFLRNDIFKSEGVRSRVQQHFFKTKSVNLSWAAKLPELNRLLAFRVGRSSPTYDAMEHSYEFDAEWNSIVEEQFPGLEPDSNPDAYVPYKSKSGHKSIYVQMLEQTTRTPRDLVIALRACAEQAGEYGLSRINRQVLIDATAEICSYVVTHMGDQISAEVNDYEHIKKAFQRMGRFRFPPADFLRQLESLNLVNGQEQAKVLCETLFEHGLLGFQKQNGEPIFRYAHPEVIFDIDGVENLLPHKAFLEALAIKSVG